MKNTHEPTSHQLGAFERAWADAVLAVMGADHALDLADLLDALDTDETCGCENTTCEVEHRPGRCNGRPSETWRCMFIGGICDACAEHMPVRYLRPARLVLAGVIR